MNAASNTWGVLTVMVCFEWLRIPDERIAEGIAEVAVGCNDKAKHKTEVYSAKP